MEMNPGTLKLRHFLFQPGSTRLLPLCSDMFSRMWRRFFRSLLNADGPWMSSVLELREQLSALYH